MSLRVLIIGGGGQTGIELQQLSWPCETVIFAPARCALDLLDEKAVARAASAADIVINCAAYTAVDRAESDSAEAWRVNALGPAMLATATAKAGIPIVHVSTDYVFDGAAGRPYVESDAVAPINVYGASKERGERAVRATNPRHAIVRTSWLVSAHRSNFLKTMMRRGAERSPLRVVADQRGRPTAAADLAAALAVIAWRLAGDRNAPAGVWHFANAGDATWFDFAEEIFAQLARCGVRTPAVEPITTKDFPTPARRPLDSRLATRRIEEDFSIAPRPWREAIAPIVAELVNP